MNTRTFFVEFLSATVVFLLSLFYNFTLSGAGLLILSVLSLFILLIGLLPNNINKFKVSSITSLISLFLLLISIFTISNFVFSSFIIAIITFSFVCFMFDVILNLFENK